MIEEVRFALDSPLEGAGFEPSVPRRRIYANTGIAADRDTGGADWREIGRLGKDSRWMQSRLNGLSENRPERFAAPSDHVAY